MRLVYGTHSAFILFFIYNLGARGGRRLPFTASGSNEKAWFNSKPYKYALPPPQNNRHTRAHTQPNALKLTKVTPGQLFPSWRIEEGWQRVAGRWIKATQPRQQLAPPPSSASPSFHAGLTWPVTHHQQTQQICIKYAQANLSCTAADLGCVHTQCTFGAHSNHILSLKKLCALKVQCVYAASEIIALV